MRTSHRLSMHQPPHPGALLREDVLPDLDLSVTQAAEQLGVSRTSLSRVLREKTAISIDLARRLETWLGGPAKGPSSETWLRMQMAYDLWEAEQSHPITVTSVR